MIHSWVWESRGVVAGPTSIIIRPNNILTEFVLPPPPQQFWALLVCLEILHSVKAWVATKAETETKSYLLVVYLGILSHGEKWQRRQIRKKGETVVGGLLSWPPLGVNRHFEMHHRTIHLSETGSIYSSVPSICYLRVGSWVINAPTLSGCIWVLSWLPMIFHIPLQGIRETLWQEWQDTRNRWSKPEVLQSDCIDVKLVRVCAEQAGIKIMSERIWSGAQDVPDAVPKGGILHGLLQWFYSTGSWDGHLATEPTDKRSHHTVWVIQSKLTIENWVSLHNEERKGHVRYLGDSLGYHFVKVNRKL